MISFSKSKFAVLGFVMVAVLLIPANDAFADHPEVAIVTVDESGFSQTCAESQGGSGCYTPVTATVEVGGVVTMTNTDPTGVHTYTSGTVDGFAPSPDGTFDTGVLMSGNSFEWIPTQAGEQPYYCMLHTWMIGTIIVQEAHADDNAAAEEAAAAEAAAELAAAEAEAAEEAAAEEAAAAAADTTPPVITIPELTTDQWGNENLELSMSGTTNFPTGSWTLDVTDNVGVADSACWANIMDDPSNPWISSSQSYDFSKITYHPNGKKFPIGPTQINCAAYDAAGNRSESYFRVVVTHDDPTGFVQYVDKPNSFGNTADSTTKIFYSAGSAQGLHLLKPIADLLTASNTQGMLARDATRTLMDGALTLDDNPNSFYTGGQYTVGNTGYGIELPKPLADMLGESIEMYVDRVAPTRSWSGNGWSVEISEDVSWLSPLNAMVKICSPSGGGTSCQENHVLKPLADMLNESNLNQAMYERSNMKILDAGGPAASAPESSSVENTYNVPTSFNCSDLSNNSSLEEAKYCIGGNYNGTGGGLDVWDGINVSAHLNSTSPTGRTLQVSAPDIKPGVLIFFEVSPGWEESIAHSTYHFYQLRTPDVSVLPRDLGYYVSDWYIPIPVDYNEPIEISWRLIGEHADKIRMINGQNIEGTTSPITVPDTTPSGPTTATGTFTVTDGANGGQCTSIGTWDSSSKTCNVTADITGGIIVGSDGITLNGNSNEFTGWISDSDCIPSCSHNISVHGKNNITIKNFESINSAGSFALAIHSSQYVTVTNNNNLGAAIIDSQHVTMTDNTIKPALQILSSYASANSCPSDLEINNNTFQQMGQNTPGMLLAGAAYQDNISCVWYNLNAAGNTGSGDVLNFNLNPQSSPVAIPVVIVPSITASTNSTSTISGKIWEDYNGNGIYDSSGITNHPGNCSYSSEGIEDARNVRLTNSDGESQEYLTHVSGGNYTFTNLIAGESYTVTYVNPWPHLNPNHSLEISPFVVNLTLDSWNNETKIVNFGMIPLIHEPAFYGTCPTASDSIYINPYFNNSTSTNSTSTPSDDNAAEEALAAEAAAAEEEIVNFTVEMTENGFSTNELQINAGDSVTFINTHYVTDINVEPHAISDPFAVPYTEHSYWIIDDSTPERVYNFDSCESYVFYDRFFDVEPIVIECGDHAAESEAAESEAAEAEAEAAAAAEAEAAAADTTPPTLTQNQNITLDATTSNGAIVNYESPIAINENYGLEFGPTCTPASGSFFQIGTTEVTCSASDWAGNVGTTSFTVTVKSLIAVPVEITTDVSITIGKSQYNTDEAIFVTGIATPFTEDNVSIQVEDSLENVVLVEQITPESSGVYTGIIFPNFLWSTSGNYTMSATYGNSTANTSFGFEFIESIIDEYLSPTGITLQTDTSMYTIGDTITIESALTDVGSDYQIGIFVEDPTGELRVIQFLNTDDSGSVSLSLKAQDNWIPGKYFVIASDTLAYDTLGDSENTRESVSFDLVKPIPEITISPTVTTTESGNTITSYDAGDMAYFSTSLLSESTSDVLVTINVVDADDTTLGVAFFKSIVGKGDSELVLGFKIPEDAADGAAKIYVNTYTDWIDQGGIVIGSELLSEVNIEGVIIEVVEETVVEETILPENTIPRLSTVTDITQSASFTTGSVVSYSLPLATSGATTLDATCTPAPGSMFPIGSTQVTCTATNDVGNTGMTSFMVTINPILQTADQSLSVKVGKDLYNNSEPLFVTGSVGTATGEPINLEVRDTQNNLISIEQVTPKESGVYSAVLTSNELWDNPGEYTIIAKYEGVIALDTFEFELIEVEEIIPEKIPTSLFIDTLDSAYVLGDVVAIGVNLVDAGAGESILLEVRDSQNDQVLLQSLNTDSDGIAVFLHQLDSSGEPGVYSVTATSDEWSFSNSENFIAVAQIPDITIGDVVSTLQDGTEVDSFESGDMGYFQTPVISGSVSDVLITVNIFDVENTPLGLAHFNSKVVDDTFDIVLGLQIPEDAVPGLATVYINTFTDWPNEGGVPILEQQVSFIEISPASTTSLTVSSEESEPVVEQVVNCGPGTENVNGICETPITGNISVNTESTSYATGNTIVISGYIKNLAEYEQPVVILIVSPDGNLVTIDQVSPDSSGNYSTTVTAGGTMNSNGEYEVRAQYGASKITSTFDFTSN